MVRACNLFTYGYTAFKKESKKGLEAILWRQKIFKVVLRENILSARGTKMLKVVADRPILSVVFIIFGPPSIFEVL